MFFKDQISLSIISYSITFQILVLTMFELKTCVFGVIFLIFGLKFAGRGLFSACWVFMANHLYRKSLVPQSLYNLFLDCAQNKSCLEEFSQAGRGREAVERWSFNPESAQCEQFLFRGRNASKNSFEDEDTCKSVCISGR